MEVFIITHFFPASNNNRNQKHQAMKWCFVAELHSNVPHSNCCYNFLFCVRASLNWDTFNTALTQLTGANTVFLISLLKKKNEVHNSSHNWEILQVCHRRRQWVYYGRQWNNKQDMISPYFNSPIKTWELIKGQRSPRLTSLQKKN